VFPFRLPPAASERPLSTSFLLPRDFFVAFRFPFFFPPSGFWLLPQFSGSLRVLFCGLGGASSFFLLLRCPFHSHFVCSGPAAPAVRATLTFLSHADRLTSRLYFGFCSSLFFLAPVLGPPSLFPFPWPSAYLFFTSFAWDATGFRHRFRLRRGLFSAAVLSPFRAAGTVSVSVGPVS